MGVSEKIT